MPEPGNGKPANDDTEKENLELLAKEGIKIGGLERLRSERLRRELEAKGLKGFKHGGTVKKTGIYELHKDEEVIPAAAARKTRRQALYGKS